VNSIVCFTFPQRATWEVSNMHKPSRRTLRDAISRTVRAATLAGTLTLASIAGANHDTGGSYYTWVEVDSVQPRYGEHYVNETVERCQQVGQPTYAGVHASGSSRHPHGHPPSSGRSRQSHHRDGSHPSAGDVVAATVLGGVIGGVVGNKIGSGRGKKPLTVAGAVIGATAANGAVQRSHQRSTTHHGGSQHQQISRRCEVVTEPRRVSYIDGYDVTYRYHGQRFTRVMHEHPGDRMRVRIDVEPII